MQEIKSSLDNAQEKIFNWSIWVAIVSTIAIILIIVTQVAAILQGYEMMNYQKNLEKLIERKINEMEALKKLSIMEKLDTPRS
jgi:CHASE1-domain containing sensor protein